MPSTRLRLTTRSVFSGFALSLALWASPGLAQDAEEAAPAEASADAGGDSDLQSEDQRSKDESGVSDEGIGLTLQDRIRAVSRKVFIKAGRFEFLPHAGVSINDAFYRNWIVGGRFSYHIFDSFSLEGGGAFNVFPERLESVRTLAVQSNLVNADARLWGYADLSGNFAPIYGKLALMSEWVVHFDGFVTGGIGATIDNNTYTLFGSQLPPGVPGVNPSVNIGVGSRIFLTRWLVVRADLRNYWYPQYRDNISTQQNLLMFNVGVGFYFPMDFDYKYTAAKVIEG